MALLANWRSVGIAVLIAYLAGGASVWKVRDWMAAEAALKAAQADIKAVLNVVDEVKDQGVVTHDTEIKAAEVKTRIQTVTRTIVERIPEYVTVASDARCIVPIGFVRAHDFAAAGVSPVPDPAGEPDDAASGVDLSTVASTVAFNYGAALENAAQLTALQGWIRAQQTLDATH